MTDTLNQATKCCNYVSTREYPVFWNPYNGVVQCHNCGHVYEPVAPSEISLKSAFTDEKVLKEQIGAERLNQMEAHAEEGGKFPYPASTVLELIHHIRAVEKVRDEWCMEYVRLRDAPKQECNEMLDNSADLDAALKALEERIQIIPAANVGVSARGLVQLGMEEAIRALRPFLKREVGELTTEQRLDAVNVIAKTIWPEAEWDGDQENANIAAIKVFHALIKQFKITRIEGGHS